jgi:muramoyltetrapeptide carboxypeptidase
MNLLKPYRLPDKPVIGIFTPGTPAHVSMRNKYLHGIRILKDLGFGIKEGIVTKKAEARKHKMASGQECAAEFMDLVADDEVHCLMANIGGWNTSSLLTYLDYDLIRAKRKIICGYSDITALHLAILKFSGLSTFYGPSVTASFGEWSSPPAYTVDHFLNAARNTSSNPYAVEPPALWSRDFIDYHGTVWGTQSRTWEINPGWQAFRYGHCRGPILVANLNALCSMAGTRYFPDFKDCVLLLEEMDAPLGRTERSLLQLKYNGVFDQISGLIFSKFEFPDKQANTNDYHSIFREVLADTQFPIMTEFDCGHTVPTLTLAQHTLVSLDLSAASCRFVIEQSNVVDNIWGEI